MSALGEVLSTPAPLPRESAQVLLEAARRAYRSDAQSKLSEIEFLTLGQTAHGEVSRFDAVYADVQYTTDFFIDELTWKRAQKVTRDLASIAGAAGDAGVETAQNAINQLAKDAVDEASKLKQKAEDTISDGLPLVVLGLLAIAVIVVVK